jgi:hypothetical protein
MAAIIKAWEGKVSKIVKMLHKLSKSFCELFTGSLINLAKHPSSTVQILGAEKALFR